MNDKKIIILSIICLLISSLMFQLTNINVTAPITSDKNSDIQTCSNLTDPWALELNGSVFYSVNGSDPWTSTGSPPTGYNFVSTAADNNNTYVLTTDGQIWRHSNATWKSTTWSKLQVSLPYKSNGWVSIDVSNKYIYVLNANGDVYRILKDPGWPNPGSWVLGSNSLSTTPPPLPATLNPPAFSFVSLAVDWNDSFCFVLRNNGEVYRHVCDSCTIWGFVGSWTNPTSQWEIYGGFGGLPPLTLQHADGSGNYWGIPSTGWVSIDVYDNYFEQNYSVYVLHNSGLVARHVNLLNWATDLWLSPTEKWLLDPRWPVDWTLIWGQATNFVSIACNDLDIFILRNTGDVFYIPEATFKTMAPPYNSWVWSTGSNASPLPLLKESKTTAFCSIDAWNEPFVLKNDGKEWSNPKYATLNPNWIACWDNRQNNGKGTLYPKVFSYSSICAYNMTTLFILSLNGTVYKSKNAGISWYKFGNLGYGNDSGWVSIAAGNYKNHSYIYALYRNGTVVRFLATLFSKTAWGNCNVIGSDASWVSISVDGNATVYTLRNLGLVSYRYQIGIWLSKGQTISPLAHQDSSWVSVAAYHSFYFMSCLRNDGVISASTCGSSSIFNLVMGIWKDSSLVAHCIIPLNYLLLTKDGQVLNLTQGLIGTINGRTGFVDICYFVDNIPWNSPTTNMVVSDKGTDYVSWTIYDDVGLANYSIYENNTLKTTGLILSNGSTISYQINKSQSCKFNYRIVYQDTMGQSNFDTITVTIDYYPWSTHPSDIFVQISGSASINWTLYDDRGYSHYQILKEGNPITSWTPWTTNSSSISYPADTSSTGTFNYTIKFNDSRNQFSSDTVMVTVYTSNAPPKSNHPQSPMTVYLNSIAYIDWILTDDVGPGYYRVLINGTPDSWKTWVNSTNIHYKINTTTLGTFNYTIQYNDSIGVFGTPNTVIVIIKTQPTTTTTNKIPGFLFGFIILGILAYAVLIINRYKRLSKYN
ncbi:MAG: hypothetical protein ACTSRP_05230 [Candidatus Helarchaeota archaeon]